MKKLKIIIVVFISFILYGFVTQQLNQDKELIIGTWLSDGSGSSKWIFTQDKKLKRINSDQLYKTYHYSIIEEKSINRKLTFSYLKLININNNNEVIEYEINALGNGKMALDYLGDTATKLLYFTKE